MKPSRDIVDFEQKAVNIFNKAALNCSGYKKFLKEHDINFNKIATFSQFKDLPLTTKSSYIEQYSIEERLYSGHDLSDYYMICTSSGSTGEPTIWPRDYESDKNVIQMNTSMYENLFDIQNKKTLVVVTFGLGAWTAGMLTSRLVWESSENHKLSVVTPGLDKVVALKVIKQLGKYYDQTIITGYPPFLIELIEYGKEENFDFKKINTKIHYTSARVSEGRRLELAKVISSTNSKYDVLGFYACSETGIIGIETKDTVDIVTEAHQDTILCEALFGSSNLPTLLEYNPMAKFLEEVDGKIVVTADQPVPLIRFDMKDRGGVVSGLEILAICNQHNVKCPPNISNKYFAYVHGRADAVRLLNNIYVDDILYCLENSKFSSRFTNNFKYGLEERGLKNRLKLIVYLKPNKKMHKAEKEEFIDELYINLVKVNADFRMIQQGISVERFNVKFLPDSEDKFKHGKFKHFL